MARGRPWCPPLPLGAGQLRQVGVAGRGRGSGHPAGSPGRTLERGDGLAGGGRQNLAVIHAVHLGDVVRVRVPGRCVRVSYSTLVRSNMCLLPLLNFTKLPLYTAANIQEKDKQPSHSFGCPSMTHHEASLHFCLINFLR